jgi:hypothetical protein
MTSQEAYSICYREKKRIPQLESVISLDPVLSYHYATEVINGTFELGEKIISDHSHYSYLYARDIIKGPFELGEKIISDHSYYSYLYARDIIKEPFEKCHHIIFNSGYRNHYLTFLRSINYDLNKISELLL